MELLKFPLLENKSKKRMDLRLGTLREYGEQRDKERSKVI